MLAAAVIVAREVLEAALIIGVIMAATRGLDGRGRWIAGGVAGGLMGAGMVAALAGSIVAAISGQGQELFNASVLFAAVAMLGWHNVWMSRHGRELSRQMAETGHAVLVGNRPLYALSAVVGLAVLREGSEVVLFLYGMILAGGSGAVAAVGGGALGLGIGAALGTALYQGLIRVPLRAVFKVTGWLILLLAAGMAAQGSKYLVQAGWLPSLGRRIWDTSAILPEDGIIGQILHTLVGYADRPTGMQIVVYVVTLLAIGLAMRSSGNVDGGRRAPVEVAAEVKAVPEIG
jgi:high-affinity iron transporter